MPNVRVLHSQEACYPYWPIEVDSTDTHGKLRVTLLSEQDSSDYIIRKMRLTKDKPQGAPVSIHRVYRFRLCLILSSLLLFSYV